MDRQFTGRREDQRMVTGHGRYTTDFTLPGQLYVHFVRADRPHAVIKGVDVTAALETEGVVAVYTGQDAIEAGFPGNALFFPLKNRNGEPIRCPHRPILAADKVRFVGEPVALVVAETRAAAEDAAELVMVDYEDLPAVLRPEDALAEGAPTINAVAPDNMGLDMDYGDAAATEAAFAKAHWKVKIALDFGRTVGNPMEPKSGVVSYDAVHDRYDLYLPNQGINALRLSLGKMTGVAEDKLRLHPIDVGGAFGIRAEAYPEYAALMMASKLLNRPVKWSGARAETFLSDHQGRAAFMTSELAIDEQGKFLGVRIDWLVDAGAYWSNAGAMVNAVAPVGMAVNVYDIPAVHGHHRLAFTNATPSCAYRGASRPNCAYLMERLVDEAGRVTGIDRLELRRRNFISKDAFPFTTATGSTYDSGDPAGLMEDVLQRSDWNGFAARKAESAARGKLRGIGCAVFISPSGSPGREQGMIRIDADGNPVLVSLSGPTGQGHETAFPEVIADMLGMKPEEVRLKRGDPDEVPLIGAGSFGSRSLIAQGGALVTAAHAVIEKGKALVAEDFDAAPEEITFEEGIFRRQGGNESMSIRELIKKHQSGGEHPLTSLGDLATQSAWPSGAHVAEVEIDPETGVLEVASYTAVDDCGRIINHTLVEGQMHGGIAQGLGEVFGELAVYDPDSGQLLTGSFMDYFMPHAKDMPKVLSLGDRPTLAPGNPLGAKGAGEAGTTGAIPTVANAVIDALAGMGVTHIDLPLTPNRLWDAMQAAPGTH